MGLKVPRKGEEGVDPETEKIRPQPADEPERPAVRLQGGDPLARATESARKRKRPGDSTLDVLGRDATGIGTEEWREQEGDDDDAFGDAHQLGPDDAGDGGDDPDAIARMQEQARQQLEDANRGHGGTLSARKEQPRRGGLRGLLGRKKKPSDKK